jgi:glycosyltransferase involved in cell wall biosynthesis
LKIAVYIEHGVGNGVGGAEVMMARLAAAWSRDHAVDLVHHRDSLTRERLEAFSNEDCSRVRFRHVPREPEPPASGGAFARYRAARSWHRDVSAGYDFFIASSHWLPCFCHARTGALVVLFPSYVRPGDSPEMQRLPAWKRARHAAYYNVEWRRRLRTYSHRFAISDFTREWTRRRWGIDCEVVHPPVEIDFQPRGKEPLILSVGRFSTMAHTKKQLEMMAAFRALDRTALGGWSYACVGGLNTRAENHVFFARVRQAAAGLPARVEANLDRAALRSLFERSKVFWHATGLNDDTEMRPDLAEHFGIATAEAMAAGCVPVVIDKGGQREIVTHGETGFLWTCVDELLAYTERLATDEALWRRMSAAARARAQLFAADRFVDRISSACGIDRRITPPAGQRAAPPLASLGATTVSNADGSL